MKINELLRKNVNNIAGNIPTIEVNLNKFKGPFDLLLFQEMVL